MSNWQGPTTAITAGPNLQRIWVFGITPERKIAMWTYDKGAGSKWSKPTVISDDAIVASGSMVTAIVCNDGEGSIRLYYEGKDNRAYEISGQFNGTFTGPMMLP